MIDLIKLTIAVGLFLINAVMFFKLGEVFVGVCWSGLSIAGVYALAYLES